MSVGDTCAFKETPGKWRLGKFYSFHTTSKSKKHQRYTGKTVNLASKIKGIGLLCSWCTPPTSTLPTSSSPGPSTPTKLIQSTTNSDRYTFANYQGLHFHCPLASYICTLPPHACFALLEGGENQRSILGNYENSVSLAMAQHLSLQASSVSYIEEVLHNMHASDGITLDDESKMHIEPPQQQWVYTSR